MISAQTIESTLHLGTIEADNYFERLRQKEPVLCSYKDTNGFFLVFNAQRSMKIFTTQDRRQSKTLLINNRRTRIKNR